MHVYKASRSRKHLKETNCETQLSGSILWYGIFNLVNYGVAKLYNALKRGIEVSKWQLSTESSAV